MSKRLTYIQSILGVDFHPNFRGIYTLECDLMFCRWHSCHKGLNHRDQHSNFQCRPRCLDTQHHADIHQFWLKEKNDSFQREWSLCFAQEITTYLWHSDWRDRLWSLVGTCIWPYGFPQNMLHLSYRGCSWHRGWRSFCCHKLHSLNTLGQIDNR